MKKLAALTLCALLAACGGRTMLKPAEGASMPVKPAGAAEAPTVAELLTPDPQARPKRSDEQLRRSEERQNDPFDLPPPG